MESIIKRNGKFKALRCSTRHLLVFSFMITVLLSAGRDARCQTFAEFFKQKKTQKKYLLQQIAALQVYLGYLEKGYQIAGEGISTVTSVRGSEADLHTSFFSSLKAVSPVVRNNAKVTETISMQLSISRYLNEMKASDYLSPENRSYIAAVSAKVQSECASGLEEMLMILTTGNLGMKEDERLNRLGRIYDEMQNRAAFVQSFSVQVKLLNSQRAAEQQSINYLRKWYENDW